jgi:hypothetical protein
VSPKEEQPSYPLPSQASPTGPGLYVTTSGGVLRCHPESGRVEAVLECRTRKWTGCFGIARHEAPDRIIVACRTRLGTRRVRKHSTDVVLYAIDPRTGAVESVGEIPGIHDVHQIACSGNLLFLTDTGLNRVHVWDLAKERVHGIIEVGDERDDINHLNALLIEGDDLLIGMNNRGREAAAIMRLPLGTIIEAGKPVLRADRFATVTPLPAFEHTHDLEPFRGEILACASHTGLVLRTAPPGILFSPGGWVRGLAADREGLWVGISTPAERSDRHSRRLDGEVRFYQAEDWTEERRIHLPGAGQVHDLLLCQPEM